MKQVKRRRRQLIRPCTQQCTAVQDVPEDLIQYIQSLLPLEDAARTSVLSKSWLHAWSTNPALRFHSPIKFNFNETKFIKVINRTLRRYRRENIPIVTFDLDFYVHDVKTVSRAHNWVRKVASKSCIKELYLCIYLDYHYIASYTLPDELFSSEKLNTIVVRCRAAWRLLHIGSNTVIKCMNLRVLELYQVNICEEVLDTILSTCNLLEKIHLSDLKLRMLKVKNLRNLHSLKIESSITKSGGLEVYQVPNLRSFTFGGSPLGGSPLVLSNSRLRSSFNIDLLGSVTTLILSGVSIVDDAVFNIIKSSFPFLLYLTLRMERCKLKVLDITCVSLKRLIIGLSKKKQIDIPIYAPKLLYFCYSGEAVPTLFINPTTTPPPQIKLEISFPHRKPTDYHSVFLKLREALTIPSKFNVSITNHFYYRSVVPSDVDDVRRRILFPATNVQQLSFTTFTNTPLTDATKAIYDGFIWVCHPNYVKVSVMGSSDIEASCQTTSNWKLVICLMLEMKSRQELKDVEIEHPVNHKWETLTSSWINYHKIPDCDVGSFHRGAFHLKFNLTWFSL